MVVSVFASGTGEGYATLRAWSRPYLPFGYNTRRLRELLADSARWYVARLTVERYRGGAYALQVNGDGGRATRSVWAARSGAVAARGEATEQPLFLVGKAVIAERLGDRQFDRKSRVDHKLELVADPREPVVHRRHRRGIGARGQRADDQLRNGRPGLDRRAGRVGSDAEGEHLATPTPGILTRRLSSARAMPVQAPRREFTLGAVLPVECVRALPVAPEASFSLAVCRSTPQPWRTGVDPPGRGRRVTAQSPSAQRHAAPATSAGRGLMDLVGMGPGWLAVTDSGPDSDAPTMPPSAPHAEEEHPTPADTRQVTPLSACWVEHGG